MLSSFVYLILLAGAQAVALRPRDDRTLGQLYAYGSNISALPVFACGDQVLMGDTSPTWCTSAYNVSFTLTSATAILASPIDASNETDKYLHANFESDVWEPASFVNSSTTTGYFTYGTELAWLDDIAGLLMSWYAVKTDMDDVYTLTWMGSLVDTNATSTAVVLRSIEESTS